MPRPNRAQAAAVVCRVAAADPRRRVDPNFRLNVIPVVLPPLRDRRDDVLPLADHFLLEHARDTGRRLALDPSAAVRLTAHRRPGNVRELQNVLQRATVLARGSTIGPEDLLFDRPEC